MCVCGGGGGGIILILFLPRSLQTQPVPNSMSYYIHQSPCWFHLFEVLSNHFVVLVILLFTFLGRCMVNGMLQIVFQVTLIVSGNLSFLNWLTIGPSKPYRTSRRLQDRPPNPPERKNVNVALGVLIGYLSIPVVLNLLSSRQVMNTSFSPLRIERTEVILQGTLSTDQKDPEDVHQWEHNPFQGRDSPSYTNTGQWRGEPLPLSTTELSMIKRRG
uniref:Lipase maturation factor n=1 Tax=Oncorhynchus mykiss TaxID=8022 RepID=A0A8C7NQG1_ONCMY